MEHALEFADTPVVSLHATPYGKPLYEKLGFRSVDRVTAHVGAFSGPAAGTSRPVEDADRPKVVAADAEVFGADRSAMWDELFGFASQVRVADDGFAAAWLEAHGVVPRATVDLMVRGAFSGDRSRLYAPVMQALG